MFVGKSTFLDHYNQLKAVTVFTEPVDKWRDLNGHNLLQMMYEDPTRHSYTFQSYVQLTMAQLHTAKCNSPIKMIERSLWSARYIFGENLRQTTKMAKSEFEVLCAWFDFLKESPEVDMSVDLVIYLRSNPEVAYERLKARARSEETVVSLDYLKQLHELHEQWLVQNKDATKYGGARVLVINTDEDLTQVPDVYSQHQDTIFKALGHWQDLSKTKGAAAVTPFGDVSNKVISS